MMAAIGNCTICKNAFQNMDLLAAVDYSVSDWSQGVVFSVNCKKPELMKKLRVFEKNEKKLCEKIKGVCPTKHAKMLCPGCAEYFVFLSKGIQEERIETPTGTLTLVRAKDPALRKEVHAWGARMRANMESFDMSQLMNAEAVSAPAKPTKTTSAVNPVAVPAAPVAPAKPAKKAKKGG